jgi:hypothetical protein
MDIASILATIDSQIANLQQARAALERVGDAPKRRGRPKGSRKAVSSITPPIKASKKRGGMSPEGRARVAAAQKARWAAQKKLAVKSVPVKPQAKAVVTKKPSSKALPDAGKKPVEKAPPKK